MVNPIYCDILTVVSFLICYFLIILNIFGNPSVLINRLSNFAASILCYVLMPLSPFFFEYLYTHPHEIATRSVMIAVSTYSFTTAFSTKFRIISILLIVIGFASGGMYGTVEEKEYATINCMPATFLYVIVGISVLEWTWRHFYENEDCLFYTIFQKRQQNEN